MQTQTKALFGATAAVGTLALAAAVAIPMSEVSGASPKQTHQSGPVGADNNSRW